MGKILLESGKLTVKTNREQKLSNSRRAIVKFVKVGSEVRGTVFVSPMKNLIGSIISVECRKFPDVILYQQEGFSGWYFLEEWLEFID